MKSLVQTILSTALLLTLFSGCTQQPRPADEIKSDPSLPVVSINGFMTDINAVAFEWKKINDPRIQGVFIYRSQPDSKDTKLHRIAIIDNRFNTHYTDLTVEPGTRYKYAFTSYSDMKTQSMPSKKETVKTLPVLDSVSFFRSIDRLPRTAKLIWRPHTSQKVESYIVERKTGEDQEWAKIATIEGRLSAEYIDADLEDNTVYKYRLRVKTFDDIISKPTEVVTVVTKPLPESVKNLKASKSQARQITLSWEATQLADFDHYNIYRSTNVDGSFDYHVKLHETTFVDKIDEDGAHYFYKITAVDKDGLESLQSNVPIEGAVLSKPKTPLMVEIKFVDNTFRLHWKKGDDRAVSYTVVKTTKESWINQTVDEITNIKETQFTDLNIASDIRYEYQIIAVDKFGVKSKPTTAIERSFKSKK